MDALQKELDRERLTLPQGVLERVQGIARAAEVDRAGTDGPADRALRMPCHDYGTLPGCLNGAKCTLLHDRFNLHAGASWPESTCTNCGSWTCLGRDACLRPK